MADSPTVIDDFLEEEHFNKILNLLDENIYKPIPHTAYETGGKGLYNVNFMAMLYLQKDNEHIQSEHFGLLYPLLKKLGVKNLDIARINCTVATPYPVEGAWHRDAGNKKDVDTTAVFYLNTNNGGTKFKGGEFIQSRANRVVIFPEPTLHAGVWCTDTKLRYVLNLNYET